LVSQIFIRYQALRLKSDLLDTSDSLFSDFLKKAESRLASGESNILEKSTAENQLAQIRMQASWLKVELDNCLLEFQLALNVNEMMLPDIKEELPSPLLLADTSRLSSHPVLKISEQRKQTSKTILRLEQSRWLPDISLSYSNMSMKGVGADNALYDQSSRFQSAQLGIGIPLFFGSRKAYISSARVGIAIAEAEYAESGKQLKNDYVKAVAEYSYWKKNVSYFEEKGLKNYTAIKETATKQFINGEINYMEWVLLNHQAISIMSEYINAKERLRQSILRINYLSVK